MRITSKGQVTIPQSIREAAGLLPDTDVDFILDADGVRIVRAASSGTSGRGGRAVERLRRHRSSVTMTTDEVMALTRGE